jgi:hypothetical protein
MMMMKSIGGVQLGRSETVSLVFEGLAEYLEISGSGQVIIYSGTYEESGIGDSIAVEYAPGIPKVARSFNIFTELGDTKDGIQTTQPTELDKISQYMQLLFDAQRSNHEVHKEIDEALALYRKAAGI